MCSVCPLLIIKSVQILSRVVDDFEAIEFSVMLRSVESHYNDVIMTTIASQITSLTIVYSTVYSGADQSKHQRSASLAFVGGIQRGPVNSPHKWPVTRKMFPFDDVIMVISVVINLFCSESLMAYCKNVVTPARKQWRGHSLALSHWYRISQIPQCTCPIAHNSEQKYAHCCLMVFRETWAAALWDLWDWSTVVLCKFVQIICPHMLHDCLTDIGYECPYASEITLKDIDRYRYLTYWGRDKMADIFKTTLSNEFPWMKTYEFWTFSMKSVPRGPINDIPALVQIMAWCRPGDKPLSESMVHMSSLLMYICVTRPQWVNYNQAQPSGYHI